TVRYSVVVPAHNEQVLLPRGLRAISAAAERVSGGVEVVVVANRCTDSTADIAAAAGAVVVESDVRNLAAVRTAGVPASPGELIVTIDADSRMSPMALSEVDRLIRTGRFVGGGTAVTPERTSLGIGATVLVVRLITFAARVSGAMFWCARPDFEAIA